MSLADMDTTFKHEMAHAIQERIERMNKALFILNGPPLTPEQIAELDTKRTAQAEAAQRTLERQFLGTIVAVKMGTTEREDDDQLTLTFADGRVITVTSYPAYADGSGLTIEEGPQ